MQVHTFYFNLFRECTYLLVSDNGSAVVIDCGCSDAKEQQRFEQYVSDNALSIKYHLLTHAHIDHIYGARFIYERYGVLPFLSSKDEWLFNMMSMQADAFGVPLLNEPLKEFVPLESKIDENMHIRLKLVEDKSCLVKVIPTPGHSEGSVCYWFEDDSILFSGDTMFQGGMGRTDFPGGNYSQLIDSLGRLCALPAETLVLPGHGFSTTIKEERDSYMSLVKLLNGM